MANKTTASSVFKTEVCAKKKKERVKHKKKSCIEVLEAYVCVCVSMRLCAVSKCM